MKEETEGRYQVLYRLNDKSDVGSDSTACVQPKTHVCIKLGNRDGCEKSSRA